MVVSAASAALAMLPILTILIIMLVLRWSAARAGVIGLIVTILVAWLGFGYGSDVYPDSGITAALMGVFAEAVFTAGTTLWILFPALCIHHFQVHTGAIEAVKAKTASLSQDPRICDPGMGHAFCCHVSVEQGHGRPWGCTRSNGFDHVVWSTITVRSKGHETADP